MYIVDVYQQPLGSHDSHNAIPTPKNNIGVQVQLENTGMSRL